MYQWFTQQLSAALPVTLKSFSARLIDRSVELTWITTDEKDNASFTIERAGEDQRYSVIATVPAATDNSGDKNYAFTDTAPLSGLNFYRLVQNDIDGKKTYLEIKKILNQVGNVRQVVVFPNPFSSQVSAFISLTRAQKVFASLTDMSGKVIRTMSGVYAEGSSEMRIRCGDLANGVYFLKVEGTDFSFIRKVVKQ
jgi:hypothetical protein